MIVSEWGGGCRDLIIYSLLNIKAWRTRLWVLGVSQGMECWLSVRVQIRSDDDREELTNLSPCMNHSVLLSVYNRNFIIKHHFCNIIQLLHCVPQLRANKYWTWNASSSSIEQESPQSSEKFPLILLSYFLMNKK